MENPYCPIEDRPNAVSATGLAQNVPSSSRRQARRHTMSGRRCRLVSVNSGACSRNLPERSFALAHNISQCPFLAPVAAESAKKVGKERQRERGDSGDGEAGKEGTEDWAAQGRAFKCAELRCAAKFSEGGEEGGGADPQMQSGQSRGPLRLLDVFQLPIVFFCRKNPTEQHRH